MTSSSAKGAAAGLLLTLTLMSAPIDRTFAGPQPETFGTPEADVALAVAASSSLVYLAGYTFGSLDGPNAGRADAFVRKYDNAGALLWGRQFGTPLYDFATGIAVDASGNVYVAGYTLGSLAESLGGYDGLLRKYSKDGVLLWTRQFGTANDDRVNAVSLDASGKIYVAGTTYGSMNGTSRGGADVFVRKFNKYGVELWTRQFGTTNDDFGNAVAADHQGNVFVVGYTQGPLAGAIEGVADAFIRKYSATGLEQWTRQFGTSGGDVASGVTTVSAGDAIVVGYTAGSFPGFTNAGGTAAFARKYSGDGQVLTTDQFGASAPVYANGVIAEPSGNYYVTGYTQGNLVGANAGGFDAFVRKYTRGGSPEWTRQFGTSGDDVGYAMATASRKLYVAGSTTGSLDGANEGGNDAFLRRLDQEGTPIWKSR